MTESLPREKCSLFELSDRAKFCVRGSDRLRFLNGQMTNDLRKATETEAIEACVLNAKGKIDAHFFIHAVPDGYLLDADAALRETLPARLDRYIIADDVQIEDVSNEFDLFHLAEEARPDAPNECRVVQVRRFCNSGWDIWVKRKGATQVRESFLGRWQTFDADSAETFRIERGLPRWGQELTNEIIPIEANLEQRCVDYAKGCYIGQEVISRIKMSGQTNKRLSGLVALDGSALSASMRLVADDGRDAGWVTSAAWSPQTHKQIALGFVKRGFNDAGTHLRATHLNHPPVPVEVVPLPFVECG